MGKFNQNCYSILTIHITKSVSLAIELNRKLQNEITFYNVCYVALHLLFHEILCSIEFKRTYRIVTIIVKFHRATCFQPTVLNKVDGDIFLTVHLTFINRNIVL